MSQEPDKEHYSYAAYADPHMARTFDDRRFGGPIGELIAKSQARVLANMVGRINDVFTDGARQQLQEGRCARSGKGGDRRVIRRKY